MGMDYGDILNGENKWFLFIWVIKCDLNLKLGNFEVGRNFGNLIFYVVRVSVLMLFWGEGLGGMGNFLFVIFVRVWGWVK